MDVSVLPSCSLSDRDSCYVHEHVFQWCVNGIELILFIVVAWFHLLDQWYCIGLVCAWVMGLGMAAIAVFCCLSIRSVCGCAIGVGTFAIAFHVVDMMPVCNWGVEFCTAVAESSDELNKIESWQSSRNTHLNSVSKHFDSHCVRQCETKSSKQNCNANIFLLYTKNEHVLIIYRKQTNQ